MTLSGTIRFRTCTGVGDDPLIEWSEYTTFTLEEPLGQRALAVADGEIVWTRPGGWFDLRLAGPHLFVRSQDHLDTLLRIDPATGDVLWETTMDHTLNFAAAAAESQVYVRTALALAAFDLQTGALTWRVPVG